MKLESSLSFNTLRALWFLEEASISRRSLLTLKKARFNPENIADCDMQNAIASQMKNSITIAGEG
jgi:hypothetical protein